MADLETIGKYEIKGVLGRGAMGVVYRGYDPNIARDVAIKTIHKSLLSTEMGQELLQRFRNEAQAVGRLTHSKIVSIYEFDEEDGMPFFVMELVEGQELKSFLKQGRKFTPEEIVRCGTEILEGLAYTHGLGIIHRDIKPANIFVLGNGSIKIADFGIARVDNSELTQIGSVLGTPSYMSPEQCTGVKVDARSDLFSVGVVLYEMLVGKKPFRGDNSNTIMLNVVNTDPDRPSHLKADLPKAFDAVLKKALAKKVDNRFQSADEFKTALAGCVSKKSAPQVNRKPVYIAAGVAATAVLSVGMWAVISNNQKTADPAAANNNTQIFQPQVTITQDTVSQGTGRDNASPTLNSNPGRLSIEPEEAEKAKRLLRVAKAHLLVGRLVSPQGSNAHDAYKLVLGIDPNSQAAKEGLELVSNKLFERTKALMAEGNDDETRRHLELALHLFPQHDGLLQLQLDLERRL